MHSPPSFSATIQSGAREGDLRVAFHVGGNSLIELLRAAELPFATLDGAPALAGNYAWPALSPRLLRALGPDRGADHAVEGTLLNCACGLGDCWPLSVNIRVQSRIVVWEGFRQLRREEHWNYRALAPMRFAAASYLEEVAKLRAVYAKHARVRELPSARMSACAL
jgi:hypothetical protein